jgi:hypothetical protein
MVNFTPFFQGLLYYAGIVVKFILMTDHLVLSLVTAWPFDILIGQLAHQAMLLEQSQLSSGIA